MASGGTHQVPYSLETTEFHDVLIQRGIISREQALISKGMSVDEANSLLMNEAVQKEALEAAKYHETASEQKNAKRQIVEAQMARAEENDAEDDDDDEELLRELEEDSEAEEILRSYREKRMQEMKTGAQKRRFGELREIFRQDWMRDVNDASTDGPVLVNLYQVNAKEFFFALLTTSRREFQAWPNTVHGQDAVESTLVVNRVMEELAPLHRDVKFLRILSTQAIEGWPDRSLPTVFLYRDGEMKEQLGAEKLCNTAGELSTLSIVKALQAAGAIPTRRAKLAMDEEED